MSMKIKGVYQHWQDSLLAKKICSQHTKNRMDDIWAKASISYPYATWNEWVDHSKTHVLNVLRNLDKLIPDYVYKEIEETEAFVLIAATLLHDIGMILKKKDAKDLQSYANLRLKHGEKGEQIIRCKFSDFLKPFEYVLNPVCEIVKNHHKEFNPIQIAGLSYDLRADALWVRLADELDFGPHHAPTWLLDYMKPSGEQLTHWLKHNEIREPAIDLDLFRIQVMGTVANEAFVRKLRGEFEAHERQDLQKLFLNRGLPKPKPNKTFLIWDKTIVKAPPGEDSKGIDARPAVFSNEQFLAAARYLYNLGRYEIARRCFEDGLDRLTGRWSFMPATPYFYHYLKTLNGMGEHEEAIRVAEEYKDAHFSSEIKAAVAASNGLAYWKTYKFGRAKDSLKKTVSAYKRLSQKDIKHKINEADAWVLHSITCLEEIQVSRRPKSREALIRAIENGFKNAQELFSQYKTEKPGVPESHYKGRYWGLRAFFSLLQIESKQNTNAKAWSEALRFAQRSYGGTKQVHRNPYGTMCGKYCAAAVYYHKYKHCTNKATQKTALSESAKLIREVRKTYDDLFSPNKRIYRLWPKIHRLCTFVRCALPAGLRLKKELSDLYGSEEPVDTTAVIYTPLH